MVINLGPVFKLTYREIWYRQSSLPENIFPPISANDLNRDIRAGIDTALQPKTRKRSASNQSLRRPNSRDGPTPLAAAVPSDNKVSPIIPSIELDAPNGVDASGGGSRPSTAKSLQPPQGRRSRDIARDGLESTFRPRSRERSPSQSRRSQDGYNTLPILKESPTMTSADLKAREGGDGASRSRRFSQLSHLSVQANPTGIEEPQANPTKQISIDDSAPSMPENIKVLMKSLTGLSNRTLDGTDDSDDPVIMETTKLAHKHDEKGQMIEIAFSSACGIFRTFIGRKEKLGDICYDEGSSNPHAYLGNADWEELLNQWENIANCLRNVMFHVSSNLRHIDDKRKPGDLLSTLANAADVADRLERDFLEIMRDFSDDKSGGGIWLTKAGPSSIIDKKIRHRLDRLKVFIDVDLVKKVNTLFQRASNILSMDESSRSLEQNISVKRLAWVNIVFLPLIFATGIFGMDSIKLQNPTIQGYIITSTVLFVLVMISIPIYKHYKRLYGFGSELFSPLTGWRSSSPEPEATRRFSTNGNATCEKSSKTERCLRKAIEEDAIETVRLHLSHMKRSYLRSRLGINLTNEAATQGKVEILQLLLDAGADVNGWDNELGVSPILCAVEAGKEAVVRELIRRGANLSYSRNKDGQTVFMIAASSADSTILECLLEGLRPWGLSYNFKAIHPKLFWIPIPTTILKKQDHSGMTALHHSANSTSSQAFENCGMKLLAKNPNLAKHIATETGKSLMMYPSVFKHLPTINILEGKGVSVLHRDKNSWTVLTHLLHDLLVHPRSGDSSNNWERVSPIVVKLLGNIISAESVSRSTISGNNSVLGPTALLVEVHSKLPVSDTAKRQECLQLIDKLLALNPSEIDHEHIFCTTDPSNTGPRFTLLAYSVLAGDVGLVQYLVGKRRAKVDGEDLLNIRNLSGPVDHENRVNSLEFAIYKDNVEMVRALVDDQNVNTWIPFRENLGGDIRRTSPLNVANKYGRMRIAEMLIGMGGSYSSPL